MSFRSRKLLDAIRDVPCQATFPHECRHPPVAAHANDSMFGRGHAFKADDCFVASLCPEAHDLIDGRKGGWDKELKRAEWMRAYVGTQRWLWTNEKLEVA